MARITTHNPQAVSARRGRSTTVIHLTDAEGAPIDLIFTSLAVMHRFAQDLTTAVDVMLQSRAGEDWTSTYPPRRQSPRPDARTTQALVRGLLQELGVLDTPFRL